MRRVVLDEWQRLAAGEPGAEALEGMWLDEPQLRAALLQAPPGDRLDIAEGRYGLVVRARQHVGVIQLGPLRLQIRPKVANDALWAAVAYALRIDELVGRPPVDIAMDGEFNELLVWMLLTESERLWRSGVQRGYRQRSEWLATPRGRLDVAVFARQGPLTRAALPCRHHAFTADIADNQVVRAALLRARHLTTSVRLRGALHRAEQQWSTVCDSAPLTAELLSHVERARNRLNARYVGVHRLARLMFGGDGPDEHHRSGLDRSPGFLWNMARLFEAFVGRFLVEHADGVDVEEQSNAGHLYRVVRGRPGQRPPRPRPDLLVRREGHVVGVFDMKYRDLWDTSLPREILYQMSVYALGWSEAEGRPVPAVVLYPTSGPARDDVEIELQVAGGRRRMIRLRAVDWSSAAVAVAHHDRETARTLAHRWLGGTRAT